MTNTFYPFLNCIGTGRLGLALHKEYVDQLREVQKLCHFRYIRGHGLFHEDIGIYQKVKIGENLETRYNFTYLDRIMDTYQELGLKPLLELGFMPKAIASAEQTLFYWACNTTPPADDDEWVRLIQATLAHLRDRYGEAEVSTWPVEVWNEPNLPGFWKDADLDAYLHLYEISSKAVKSVLPDIQVGGPAVCGGSSCNVWVDTFLTYCETHDLPLDFITRHLYMAQTPERHARYTYHVMCDADFSIRELHETNEIIRSHPRYAGLPLYVTEFNSSYNPFCPIHDTVQNAALMADLLSRLGEECALASYWTFGDVFEEQGIPGTPFHGGFGLMGGSLIPKPTLWTFAFFEKLRELGGGAEPAEKGDRCLLMKTAGGYAGMAWQLCPEKAEERTAEFRLSMPGRCCLTTRTVDMENGNPLAAWHAMGQPASLSKAQADLLRQAAMPRVSVQALESEDGQVTVRIPMKDNAVVFFTLESAPLQPDDGYDAGWYR